jgi:hypothetical protein
MGTLFEHRMMTVVAADVTRKTVAAIGFSGGYANWDITDIFAIFDVRICDQRDTPGAEKTRVPIEFQDSSGGWTNDRSIDMICPAGGETSLKCFYPILCQNDTCRVIVTGADQDGGAGSELTADEFIYIDVIYAESTG